VPWTSDTSLLWGPAAQAREYLLKASVDCGKQKYPQDQRPGLHEGYDRELCQLGYYGLHDRPSFVVRAAPVAGARPRIVLLNDTIARVNFRKNEESWPGRISMLKPAVARPLTSRSN
jgi:hypothetical protein